MSPFCTSDATGEDVDVTRAAVASSLSEALAARDRYDVQAGNYSFFFLKDCATYDLDSCFALNADSPYGMTFLPDAPGQAEYDGCVADGGACGLGCNPNDNPDLDTKICYDGKTMKWLLGEDDAVVVLMEAPPECKYWSVTYYQMSKYYADEAGLRSEEPDSFESELQEKASECADPPARCQTFGACRSLLSLFEEIPQREETLSWSIRTASVALRDFRLISGAGSTIGSGNRDPSGRVQTSQFKPFIISISKQRMVSYEKLPR